MQFPELMQTQVYGESHTWNVADQTQVGGEGGLLPSRLLVWSVHSQNSHPDCDLSVKVH